MRHLVLSLLVLGIPVLSRADITDVSVGSATEPQSVSFSVPVNISNVTDLYAFEFDLSWNPAIVQLQSVTEGPFLASAGTTFFIPPTIDNGAGNATFTADTLIGQIPGASGSGVLADLNFLGVAQGTSNLTLSNVLLFDSGLNSITPITTGAGQAVIGVPAVPEPAFVLPLGAICLLLCGALVYKRRRAVTEL